MDNPNWDTTTKTCKTHSKPLAYSKKLKVWYCYDCLYSSHLTHQAQTQAMKRYRQSEQGKQKAKDWEHTEKGRKARERYLKSEKYKAARKAYNERLKVALKLARAAHLEAAKHITPEEIEVKDKLAGLLADIREYMDSRGTQPSVSEVIRVAKEDYQTTINADRAKELIEQAKQRRGVTQKA